MKEFKYKTIFSSVIKPIVSKEKNIYLAKASLNELRQFIPDIDLEKNYDLLAVAFPLFNVNYFNKNDDGVDTAFALQVYKSFVNKFIDLNHKRDKLIGVILSAHITEFGTDKPLTEDDVKGTKDIFNITVGGVLWRAVNEDLANLIEDSNNILDENYDKIKASFEVGFTDIKLVKCSSDSRSLAEGTIIDDPKEINKLSSNLKAFGGTGQLEDGSRIYRLLAGEGIGLGAGITESPAAFLNPIAVPENSSSELSGSRKDILNICKNKISQLQSEDVITNKNLNSRKNMKITSIKDITDESLKEITASTLVDFVETELKTASEKYVKEKQEKELIAADIQKKHDELLKTHESLVKDLETLKANLQKLEQEKIARENQALFNARMANFEDKYELTSDELAVVGSQIKDLNDEQYKKVEANLVILLKNKDKQALAKEKKIVQQIVASETKEQKTETVIVDKALDSAKQTSTEVAATSSIEAPKSLRERYAKAFSPDQFNFIK